MEDFSSICKGYYMYHRCISKVSKGISRKKIKKVFMKKKFVIKPNYITLSNDYSRKIILFLTSFEPILKYSYFFLF